MKVKDKTYDTWRERYLPYVREATKGDLLKQKIPFPDGTYIEGKNTIFKVTSTIGECTRITSLCRGISFPIVLNDSNIYFDVVHPWSPWIYIRMNGRVCYYKTNNKRIKFYVCARHQKPRIVSCSCHPTDEFNLQTGLDMCYDRWIERYEKFYSNNISSNTSSTSYEEVLFDNGMLKIVHKGNDIFTAPFNSLIVCCGSVIGDDIGLVKKIQDSLPPILKDSIEDERGHNRIGEVLYGNNIFILLVKQSSRDKANFSDFCECLNNLAEEAVDGEIYAIPKLGEGLHFNWEKAVLPEIIEKFTNKNVTFNVYY